MTCVFRYVTKSLCTKCLSCKTNSYSDNQTFPAFYESRNFSAVFLTESVSVIFTLGWEMDIWNNAVQFSSFFISLLDH